MKIKMDNKRLKHLPKINPLIGTKVVKVGNRDGSTYPSIDYGCIRKPLEEIVEIAELKLERKSEIHKYFNYTKGSHCHCKFKGSYSFYAYIFGITNIGGREVLVYSDVVPSRELPPNTVTLTFLSNIQDYQSLDNGIQLVTRKEERGK